MVQNKIYVQSIIDRAVLDGDLYDYVVIILLMCRENEIGPAAERIQRRSIRKHKNERRNNNIV